MFSLPPDHDLTMEELEVMILTLNDHINKLHEQVVTQYEMIEEMSELVAEVSEQTASTLQMVFEESTKQSKLRDDFRRKHTTSQNK